MTNERPESSFAAQRARDWPICRPLLLVGFLLSTCGHDAASTEAGPSESARSSGGDSASALPSPTADPAPPRDGPASIAPDGARSDPSASWEHDVARGRALIAVEQWERAAAVLRQAYESLRDQDDVSAARRTSWREPCDADIVEA